LQQTSLPHTAGLQASTNNQRPIAAP